MSDLFVLTAQHCFTAIYNMADVRVVVGQYNMKKKDKQEMAFEVDWKEAHPLFRTSGPQSHDLAIIKLKPKGDGGAGFGVKMSAAVSPICIPEPGDLFKDDLPCVVSGWGQILRKYQKHALKKGWPLANWPLHWQVLCNSKSSWDEKKCMPFV